MPAQPTPAMTARFAGRATPRDYALLDALHTHRVLTTRQAAALFFGDPHSRRARTRLLQLHRLGAVDRFRPHTATGSAPWHWVLAPVGAHALAHRRGVPFARLRWRHDHALAIAHSTRLAHTTGTTDCLVAFTRAARATPGAALETWWGEARCAAEWGRHIRPDAYLRWRQDGTVVDAFVEYDTGTEPLDRVAAKLPGYAALAHTSAITTPLLVITTGPIREENLAERLASAAPAVVPTWLTTVARLDAPGPAAAVWRPASAPDRHLLAALAPAEDEDP
ncbi:replication-relaxation family protein [Actinorugispora endophytica]|uniref:Protein involved in plasmid replication-relaxation n=1 Tax=Actinorugispora endophytica TaxID=1605990 RepID=A0A4R6V2X2_9ACTN|nr:replication-relaxation family protein [Actinorugispora endophytica]TDQ54390.1 protein involved in plasmid replication-relaxation [Actinorugispora endophytica]